MNKFYKISFFNHVFPGISWDINHRSKQFQHQISVLAALLHHNSIILKMCDKNLVTIRVKLRNISYTFEQQSVTKLTSSCYQLIELSISSQHVCISLICGKINRQSNKFLAYNWLWAMDNQLVHQRDTVCVSERGFSFVL